MLGSVGWAAGRPRSCLRYRCRCCCCCCHRMLRPSCCMGFEIGTICIRIRIRNRSSRVFKVNPFGDKQPGALAEAAGQMTKDHPRGSRRASLPTPQSDAECAGIARARRCGHVAKSARPWRCAVARGGAISRRALGARRTVHRAPSTEVYLTCRETGSRKKEFHTLSIYGGSHALSGARARAGLGHFRVL